MKPVHTFAVIPSLPPSLERLRELAYNLRWSWNHATIELFRRLDSDLWEASGHNPVLMLGTIDQERLNSAANDEGFMTHLEGICQYFDAYCSRESTWFRRTHIGSNALVAYFSAEFGVTECLSIFAGGLGVLAGDHLKSASDLGIPIVAVGLLYQEGYFRQYLNETGWQQEAYEDNDFHNLPLALERTADGRPLEVQVAYPGRQVTARIWRAQVGRVALYLLDTNVSANNKEDQDITDQLYGGDLEIRLKQEIMLGIGGYRSLEALGLHPNVYHMNEGHAAFLSLERIRSLKKAHGVSFAQAREVASAGLIFTTHTPVAAGHDYFPAELMDRYFNEYARDLGISRQEFLDLGRQNLGNEADPFCMTVLALRLASKSNAVSMLHGEVTRRMWRSIWPGLPENEIPIGHVTNGVHFRSWISQEMDQLYDRYLGQRWSEEPSDEDIWQHIERIPAEELWRTHERRRERLVFFARERLRVQARRRGAPLSEVEAADEVLDPQALTIGFARRFATYKRATLLLSDLDRLARILNDPDNPVQIIFAGKAHPRDDAGKGLIQQIVQLSHEKPFQRRLIFLENYDVAMARYLVQGADVWLNTPRRTLEASGTSGMKAAANGALNLSTLDGWWDEAWRSLANKQIGWTIGRDGADHDDSGDSGEQDHVEADALYNLLEGDVVPTFYDRSTDGLPHRWIAQMKSSIGSLCHYFNTHRMSREYTEHYYLPAAVDYERLIADNLDVARELAAWKSAVKTSWPQVRVEGLDSEIPGDVPIRGQIRARAKVRLGSLTPDDVNVEIYLGKIDANGEIVDAEPSTMAPIGDAGGGWYLFEAQAITCCESGLNGYTFRVLPRHPHLNREIIPGLICWAS